MISSTALATILLVLPGISGFTASYPKIVRSLTTKLNYHPQTFERAVECAQNYGLCDIEELLSLSSELDQFQGCFYEDDEEACDKEIHVSALYSRPFRLIPIAVFSFSYSWHIIFWDSFILFPDNLLSTPALFSQRDDRIEMIWPKHSSSKVKCANANATWKRPIYSLTTFKKITICTIAIISLRILFPRWMFDIIIDWDDSLSSSYHYAI